MSLEHFLHEASSSWMNQEGPDSEIVLTSRVRLARNLKNYRFPSLFSSEEAREIVSTIQHVALNHFPDDMHAEFLKMDELKLLEKRVLVEKHLISPQLAEESNDGAVILSSDEDISIMINEEDHLRIQCLSPGLQLHETLEKAGKLDDLLESWVDYAFDETLGYLTSCPTNVGTGIRASAMVHLPGLVLTQQINQIIPAIHQLGLVVRGIYGEGSEAIGNIFQISNQMTLGKSEENIVSDLTSVIKQIIAQERSAREALMQTSNIQLEDRVYRSLGVLQNSRIIETKEAAQCLSDVRLGIDLGYIQNISKHILNELMILTQPGFLQLYAGRALRPYERDIRRATLIRERLRLEETK
ncbi:protein-arginine kinase [Weizmannia acidilactici]|uniref:Protein-arginine kinase n=1 Tax=Weizmannia acidilactici TaxID=2607726 RepID=A0A5J4JDZ9_9BACI|nr:protein arginine kinase [Weizmannia acidilactici]GER67289.1 protein-arginine kinase [Weizmannia acidilactici]GER69931.1 protein-arginine kinase [Weizmannia acidilactici]GER73290.1 protein-arginine kinase [Weizmannia acidilactici]